MPNRLIDQNSPYLKQHARNPVEWEPWGPAAWERARAENKLVLVSIGYAACHWCHVMERESFEDAAVAVLMNAHFVCIKVDREERPDIDQVHLEAVQAMTGRGGWPLNCFTLPDGRPVFGGTYFPRDSWVEILQKLASLWQAEPGRLEAYAETLTEGLRQPETVWENSQEAFSSQDLTEAVAQWSASFDRAEGGTGRAPKFPLPDNYGFLLRQARLTKDKGLQDFVLLTLDKMAAGGIYDHLGGGFSRYSTDQFWKVPHFEKMLYDNAQLVSLYAEAFRVTGRPRYRQVVEETLAFVDRELRVREGQWASSLDADSDGEEGRFYVWTEAELKEVLGPDWAAFGEEYDLGPRGLWEEGRIILLHRKLGEPPSWEGRSEARGRLSARRDARIRPALDDKVLTSWNALMVKAWANAWEALGDPWFKAQALAGAKALQERARRDGKGLWHSALGRVGGFLEDFAFTVEAFLTIYRLEFDETWLSEAALLTEFALEHFRDPASPLLFFTSDQDPALLLRKHEVSDNVIPSSNAVMAEQLFLLGHWLGRTDWTDRAKQMLATQRQVLQYGSGTSRWMQLQQYLAFPFREVVVVGPDWKTVTSDLQRAHPLNALWAAGPTATRLPLLEGRGSPGRTLIYICEDGVCGLPREDAASVISILASAFPTA